MNIIGWFADPVHWSGPAGVPVRLLEHLYYSSVAIVIAVIIAVPVGAAVGHTGRGGFLIVGLANWLRSLPDLGLLILLVLLMSINLVPVTLALLVLAVPPLLAGTYAGISNVDPAVVDAARGMGMREREILLKAELPNALPLLLGGLRAATLQVVATTAIAAYVSYGGLGRYLIDGKAQHDYTQMAAGAALIAGLALIVEGLLAAVQQLVVSPGLRAAGKRERTPDDPAKQAPPAQGPVLSTHKMAGVN
jgi:osmoprotectant transport system permease protein